MHRAIVGLAAASVAAVLTACGSGGAAGPGARPSGSTTGSGLLVGVGTVLDDGDGPEFCLGGVAQSYPPQCGGPALVGWRWPEREVQRAGGVTWTDRTALVGRYHGERFTVIRTVDPDRVEPAPSPDRDLRSPCPVPDGGWRPVDPGRATVADQERVFSAAARLPDYADSWIDDRGAAEQAPDRIVVNVRVTGDRASAERTLRAICGGSLCVSAARHTSAELQRITEEIVAGESVLVAGPGDDRIDVAVVHDDGRLQQKLDRRYGPDLVRVQSVLQPYRG